MSTFLRHSASINTMLCDVVWAGTLFFPENEQEQDNMVMSRDGRPPPREGKG